MNAFNDILPQKTKRLSELEMPLKRQHHHQLSLLEYTLKKNQSQSRAATPKSKLASTYTPFNIDERRMENLERKLFGEPSQKQSRFSVNGEDWKNDREMLVEIMCSIKSPPKRHSAYLISGGDTNFEKAEVERKKEEPIACKEKKEANGSPASMKDETEDDKTMIMKSLLYSPL
jgi:hypothetical protein